MLNLLTQNLKTSNWMTRYAHHFLMVLCAVMLSACGGGGGGSNPENVDTTLSTTPILSPASTTNGARRNGVLNIDIVTIPYARFLGSTTVAYTAPQTGVIALGNGLGTVTVSPVNTVLTGFVMAPFGADGNAVLYCSSIASSAGRALLSSNLIPVNNLNEIKGKSFKINYCEFFYATLPNLVFNSDGSASIGSETLSQGEVLSFFSANGVGFGTPQATRWRAYKALVDGQYVYAILDEGRDSAGYYIGLLTQDQ
jgi:hypothetical protein